MDGIEGGIAAITQDGVVGWAWCPGQPHDALTVVLQAGGIEVGRARADRFDPAILATHRRPGVPGFCIRLNRLPGGLYPQALTLHHADGAAERIGGPFMVTEIAELIPVTDAVAAEYEGSIDELANGVLSGWARDAALADWAVCVDLLDCGQRISRTRADLPREDLRQAGKGAGRHGFRLILPNSLLDGRLHRLQVRIAGSKFELANGPITFGPLDTADPMTALRELRQDVARLTDRVDALSDPSGAFLNDLVRRLNDRMAALAEVHRERIEGELNALRRFAFRPAADPE
jgi:hypothetical protein